MNSSSRIESWSLSKIGTFEKCPAKYRYRYVEKLPDPPGASASRGLEMHSSIEQFLLGTVETLSHPLDHYQAWLSGLKAGGARPEVRLAVNDQWEPVPWDSPSVWLRSVLDALILVSANAALYDWKTGKEYDDHYDQKELYALTVFSHYPEVQEVSAIHVYLDHGRNTSRTYHRSLVPTLRERWTKRAVSVLTATEFFPNPHFGCRYCNYSKSKGGPCRF